MSIKQQFDQFVSNINGQFIEVSDSTNLNQCLDLCFLWVFVLGFPKATIQHLYAYEVFSAPTALTKQYFDIIPNGPTNVPTVGDLVVWKKGYLGSIAGHIAIASSDADINRFKSIDQNLPLKSTAHLQEHNYDMVAGWLHPKPAIIAQPIAQSVFNDQTIIPKELLAEDQDLEIQQIRGLLLDGKRDDLDLQNTKEELKNYKIANNEQAIMIRDLRNENDKQVLLISQLEKDLGTVTAFNTPKTADNLTVSQLLTALINKLFFDK